MLGSAVAAVQGELLVLAAAALRADAVGDAQVRVIGEFLAGDEIRAPRTLNGWRFDDRAGDWNRMDREGSGAMCVAGAHCAASVGVASVARA